MKEICLLPGYFPTFGTISTCSSIYLDILDIPRDILSVYASDLGHTYNNFKSFCNNFKNVKICSTHLQILKNRDYNRQRAVRCSVPSCLAAHQDTRKFDRRLTEHQFQQILEVTGTGTCRQCIKLFKDDPNDITARKADKEQGNEDVHNAEDSYTIPPKRKRTKAIQYEFEEQSIQDEFEEQSIHDTTDSYDSAELGLSQETTFYSQSSEASVSSSIKLDALNRYISLFGTSPIKECKLSVSSSNTRTQKRYIDKAKKCIEHLLSTICPGEEDFLKNVVMNHSSSDSENRAVLETLVETYNKGGTPPQWPLPRQILSTLVKDRNFSEAKQILPDLTRWKYKNGKDHISQYGVGVPVPDIKNSREKYSVISQIDHFIDFITSGQVIKDQPFGEKTLKMETGQVIKIPTVIRRLMPSSIISQYMDLCCEDNVKSLGESTLFKILDECSAVVRKCVEGLDNFIMEGCKGFEELEKVLTNIPGEDSKRLNTNLQKTYLKTGYKIAGNLEDTLNDAFKTADNYNWDNKEATMYMEEKTIQAIGRWKAHLVFSRNQEQAKSDLLKEMSGGQAIITSDWAMKYLPRNYREGPCDRRAAHIKAMIRRYINQGYDVTSAFQMKKAVQIEGKCKADIKIKVVNAVNVLDGKQGKSTIPLISKLYSFVYETGGMRMWKAYNIGEGTDESTKRNTIFDCPVEYCTKQFSSQKAVDDHILLSNCSFDGKERLRVAERAKYLYANIILSLYPSDHPETSCEVVARENDDSSMQHSGWALKEAKPRTTFNDQQKQYMTSKFNIGKTTGNKVDPYQASEEMRFSGKFKREDFLSGQQIASYFSRLAYQDRKTSSEDFLAEDKKQNLKHEIENCIKHT